MDTTLTGSKFKPSETPEVDKVWVYGKKSLGWYVARWKWDEKDATRWESLGFQVERSTEKPVTAQMTISEVYGEITVK